MRALLLLATIFAAPAFAQQQPSLEDAQRVIRALSAQLQRATAQETEQMAAHMKTDAALQEALKKCGKPCEPPPPPAKP